MDAEELALLSSIGLDATAVASLDARRARMAADIKGAVRNVQTPPTMQRCYERAIIEENRAMLSGLFKVRRPLRN